METSNKNAAPQAQEEETKETAGEPEAEPDYKALLDAAEREKQELRDKVLRYAAECENVRRRAERETANARDYAVESFARDMAAVLENLFRAEESVEGKAQDADFAASLAEGVTATRKEMESALARHGVKRVLPVGEKFDHNLHQAVTQAPSEEYAPGTVTAVCQSGYTLKGRLLRPALVVVAAEKAPE
jgi:molecular chaperone GrpE